VSVVPVTRMTALSIGKGISLNNAEELEATLRHIGATRYHSLHPFHKLLHGGKLNKGQVQAWALNRYYYQASIPAKDAAVLGRLPTPELRREWRRRIVDHDGDGTKPARFPYSADTILSQTLYPATPFRRARPIRLSAPRPRRRLPDTASRSG